MAPNLSNDTMTRDQIKEDLDNWRRYKKYYSGLQNREDEAKELGITVKQLPGNVCPKRRRTNSLPSRHVRQNIGHSNNAAAGTAPPASTCTPPGTENNIPSIDGQPDEPGSSSGSTSDIIPQGSDTANPDLNESEPDPQGSINQSSDTINITQPMQEVPESELALQRSTNKQSGASNEAPNHTESTHLGSRPQGSVNENTDTVDISSPPMPEVPGEQSAMTHSESINTESQVDHFNFEKNENSVPGEIFKNGLGVKFQIGDVIVLGSTPKTYHLAKIVGVISEKKKVSVVYVAKKRDKSITSGWLIVPFTKTYQKQIAVRFNHVLYKISCTNFLSTEEDVEIRALLKEMLDH